MTKAEIAPAWITKALEDYLETIFLLVRDHGFARVRDIASARKVKASSVSPALKRLAEQGLVRYVQREYVGLTEQGTHEARRVLARHELLTRFFRDVLRMPAEAADQEACAIEHCLTAEAMNRLARFFEFSCAYPESHRAWQEKFLTFDRGQDCEPDGRAVCAEDSPSKAGTVERVMSVSDLKPGQQGIVRQVNAKGAIRQRLLDMGLLPDVVLRVERVAPVGDPVWISLHGSQLALRRKEAKTVLISKV